MEIILSFIYKRALLNQFSVSYISGIKYQFLIVTVLKAQQSTQKCKLPLGFLININNTAIGKELTLINSLLRLLSKYFYSTQNLFQNILYRGLNLGCFPFLSTILQSYNQYSSSLSASFYKNTFRQLQYFTSTFIVGLVCFFSIKAFLISAIITAKIVYLGFCKGYFGPYSAASPRGSQGSPRLAFSQPLAPPYKHLGLTALPSSSVRLCTRLLPTLITISSSSINSPCNLCSACLLPTIYPSNVPYRFLANYTNEVALIIQISTVPGHQFPDIYKITPKLTLFTFIFLHYHFTIIYII